MSDRVGWRKGLLWVVLFLFILILTIYYVPHKPFDHTVFISILHSIADLVLAAVIVMLAGGIGQRILGTIHPDDIPNLILQAAFGLGLLALLLLGIGLAGLFHPGFLWGLLVLPGILLWRSISTWLNKWVSVYHEFKDTDQFQRLLGVMFIFVISLHLIEALAPPVHFDALVYHLSLPLEFLENGRFMFSPENPYWGMPLSAEFLYTWAMALGRPQTSVVLGWCVGCLALVGVLGFGKSISSRAGWVAVAALLAGETLAGSLGWAYADWGAALLGISVIIAMDAWKRQSSRSILIVAGLLVGFGFGFKYTAGILLFTSISYMFPHLKRKDLVSALMVVVASAGMIALIWLGKNLIFTASPLYPFMGSARWIDPLKTDFYNGTVSPWPLSWILLTPLSATILGVEGAQGYSASIGPLMFALSLGVFFLNKDKRKSIHAIGLFVLVGWIIWACATAINPFLGQSRLYYAIFPGWALLAAAGYEGFANGVFGKIRFERIVAVFVVLSLAFSGFTNLQASLKTKPLPVVLGLEQDQVYLTRALGAYYPAMQAVQELPEGSSVLNLWEPRGFYCRPICLADYWIDRWYLDRQRFGDGQGILQQWQREGFTHVLLHVAGMEFIKQTDERYLSQDWAVLETIREDLTLMEEFGDGYTLYRISQ